MINRILVAFAFTVTLGSVGCGPAPVQTVAGPEAPAPPVAVVTPGPVLEIEIVPAPRRWDVRSLGQSLRPDPAAVPTPTEPKQTATAPTPAPAAPRATPTSRPNRDKEARATRNELKPDVVSAAIKRQLPRVRACYERALKSDAGLDGRLTLNWTVQPAGTVADVRVVNDKVGSDRLSSCVTRAVGRWSFPASSDGADIEYPVVLRRSRGLGRS
jgi:outer membrane biosynthesis protein TonB